MCGRCWLWWLQQLNFLQLKQEVVSMQSSNGRKAVPKCCLMLAVVLLLAMVLLLINGKQLYEFIYADGMQQENVVVVDDKPSTNAMTAQAVGGTSLFTVYYVNIDETTRSFFVRGMGDFNIPGFFKMLDSVSGSMSNVVAVCTIPLRAVKLDTRHGATHATNGVKFYETTTSMARLLLSASITCLQTYFSDITKTSNNRGCDLFAEDEMVGLCKEFVDERERISKFASMMLLLTSVNLDE